MFQYLGFSAISCISSMTSLTITNGILIDNIKSEYYLGRDIPGQMVSLITSLYLSYRYKSNPLRLGLITASIFPLSIGIDLSAGRSKDPELLLLAGSILRGISFVGPVGAHTTVIVNISRNVNPSLLGNKNTIFNSLGATIGISSGLFLSKYFDGTKECNAILFSFMYPVALYAAWRKYI